MERSPSYGFVNHNVALFPVPISQNPPGAIAPPSRKLAQAQIGDEVLPSPRRNFQLLRQQFRRDDRLCHGDVQRSWQMRRPAPALQPALARGQRQQPAVVILHALFGGGQDRGEPEQDFGDLLAMLAPEAARRPRAAATPELRVRPWRASMR